jgi:hypothetical protein
VLKLLKTENGFNTKGMTVCDGKRSYVINTSRDINIDCFCFNTTDEEYAVLNKLENCNKTTLKGNADFALGIVTGKNSRYISKTKQPKYETVVKGSDIYKFRIESMDRYIRFNPENFQQTAPEKYYRADEKLIYRFICSQLVFAYDDKQRLSLNSGNILIPRISGMDMKYILAVLNSKPAQFYFRKCFNSVKVLRAHIEKIPIPIVDDETQAEVVELTDGIMNCCDDGEVKRLYDELNVRIANIYGLTDSEYNVIKNATECENEFLGV